MSRELVSRVICSLFDGSRIVAHEIHGTMFKTSQTSPLSVGSAIVLHELVTSTHKAGTSTSVSCPSLNGCTSYMRVQIRRFKEKFEYSLKYSRMTNKHSRPLRVGESRKLCTRPRPRFASRSSSAPQKFSECDHSDGKQRQACTELQRADRLRK